MTIDYEAIPAWHRAWIKQHARDSAARAYLEMASSDFAFDRDAWEAAGAAVVRDIAIALDGFEDYQTTCAAQMFGAEIYVRRTFDLARCSPGGGYA